MKDGIAWRGGEGKRGVMPVKERREGSTGGGEMVGRGLKGGKWEAGGRRQEGDVYDTNGKKKREIRRRREEPACRVGAGGSFNFLRLLKTQLCSSSDIQTLTDLTNFFSLSPTHCSSNSAVFYCEAKA